MEESKLREFIKSILRELEDEDIEEVTATGDVDGYATPKAFAKKKKKKRSGFGGGHYKADVFDYTLVKEALDKKDLEVIRKLIRDVIGDVYRDIWLKRSVWK